MIEAKANFDASSEPRLIGSALIKEAELWMDAQGDVLSDLESMMSRWMQRQRQAFEVSSRSVRKISDARNLFDLLLAQNELVSDCLQWTVSEIRALGQDTTVVTRKATERSGQVLQPERPREPAASIPLERAAAE